MPKSSSARPRQAPTITTTSSALGLYRFTAVSARLIKRGRTVIVLRDFVSREDAPPSHFEALCAAAKLDCAIALGRIEAALDVRPALEARP